MDFLKVRKRNRITGKKWNHSSVTRKKIQLSKTTHGMSETRFYNIWLGIKNRCGNKNMPVYRFYGGRGIINFWVRFESFRDDMLISYGEHLKIHGETNTTIERIDYNKGYFKENCKWATKQEQSNNRRSCVFITFNGETLNIGKWSKKLNISRSTIRNRLYMGWPTEKVLSI